MITFRFYDKEARIDRAWYDSSNVLYSECEDKENDYKLLKVVFKNGGTYLYKKVDVNDYLMFMAGGLDGSNGKALNKFIKAKCEFEKLPDTDLAQLNGQLEYYKRRKKEEAKKAAETAAADTEDATQSE